MLELQPTKRLPMMNHNDPKSSSKKLTHLVSPLLSGFRSNPGRSGLVLIKNIIGKLVDLSTLRKSKEKERKKSREVRRGKYKTLVFPVFYSPVQETLSLETFWATQPVEKKN